MFRPRNGPQRPNRSQKSKNLKFELGEKLDHYSWVKFHCESNGDSFDPLKRCLDPEMANNGLIWAKNRKILMGLFLHDSTPDMCKSIWGQRP